MPPPKRTAEALPNPPKRKVERLLQSNIHLQSVVRREKAKQFEIEKELRERMERVQERRKQIGNLRAEIFANISECTEHIHLLQKHEQVLLQNMLQAAGRIEKLFDLDDLEGGCLTADDRRFIHNAFDVLRLNHLAATARRTDWEHVAGTIELKNCSRKRETSECVSTVPRAEESEAVSEDIHHPDIEMKVPWKTVDSKFTVGLVDTVEKDVSVTALPAESITLTVPRQGECAEYSVPAVNCEQTEVRVRYRKAKWIREDDRNRIHRRCAGVSTSRPTWRRYQRKACITMMSPATTVLRRDPLRLTVCVSRPLEVVASRSLYIQLSDETRSSRNSASLSGISAVVKEEPNEGATSGHGKNVAERTTISSNNKAVISPRSTAVVKVEPAAPESPAEVEKSTTQTEHNDSGVSFARDSLLCHDGEMQVCKEESVEVDVRFVRDDEREAMEASSGSDGAMRQGFAMENEANESSQLVTLEMSNVEEVQDAPLDPANEDFSCSDMELDSSTSDHQSVENGNRPEMSCGGSELPVLSVDDLDGMGIHLCSSPNESIERLQHLTEFPLQPGAHVPPLPPPPAVSAGSPMDLVTSSLEAMTSSLSLERDAVDESEESSLLTHANISPDEEAVNISSSQVITSQRLVVVKAEPVDSFSKAVTVTGESSSFEPASDAAVKSSSSSFSGVRFSLNMNTVQRQVPFGMDEMANEQNTDNNTHRERETEDDIPPMPAGLPPASSIGLPAKKINNSRPLPSLIQAPPPPPPPDCSSSSHVVRQPPPPPPPPPPPVESRIPFARFMEMQLQRIPGAAAMDGVYGRGPFPPFRPFPPSFPRGQSNGHPQHALPRPPPNGHYPPPPVLPPNLWNFGPRDGYPGYPQRRGPPYE